MLQSLLVYISVSLILFALGWHLNTREQKLKLLKPDAELSFWSWEIVVSVIVITLMMGLRFHTGADYDMYLKEFQEIRDKGHFTREFEIGFYWITWIFAKSGLHFSFYFGFWAFVQALALYYGLRHHKYLLPWVGMILILGPYGLKWLSFMRQWTVSMLLVAMIPLIVKRKFIPYLILSLLAITIHKSAWLLIVIYFLSFIKLKVESSRNILIAFAICVVLGIWPIWFKLLSRLPFLLDLIGYDKYWPFMEDAANGQFHYVNWGPLHLIMVLSCLFFIYYFPKVKLHFKNDKLLPFFFILGFVGACYENLFMNTHYAMLRPMEYLYIFIIMMISYTVAYLTQTKKYIQALTCCSIPCLYLIISIIKVSFGLVSFPSIFYHFIFE